MIKTVTKCFADKRVKSAVTILALILSNVFLFLSGGSFNKTKIENISYTLCGIANKSSSGNAFITLVKKEPGFKTYNNVLSYSVNYCNMFYNSSPFQYFPTFNGLKNKDFCIDELSELDSNLTLLLCGAFSSHKSGDGKSNIFDACYLRVYNEKTNTVINDECSNFLLISDKQARYLRDNVWHLDYDDDSNFDFAIGKLVSANFNGEIKKWKVGNVFFTDGDFSLTANSIYNEFAIAYYHGMPNKDNTQIEIACSFQKSRFICYNKLIDAYSHFGIDNYEYYVNESPLLDSKSSKDLKHDLNESHSTGYFFYVGIVLSLILYILFVLCLLSYREYYFKISFYSVASFAFSWILFKVVSLISNSSIFFSYFSLALYAFYFVIFLLVLIVFWRKKLSEKNN